MFLVQMVFLTESVKDSLENKRSSSADINLMILSHIAKHGDLFVAK